jgi:hypothetical protein
MHRTSVLTAHTQGSARSTRKRSPAHPAFDGHGGGRAQMPVWVAALIVAALMPAFTLSCGGRETNMSTKTGNPPVIDQTRVRIVGADGEVVVSGDEGAVQTSGDEQVVAKVTNRSNDATGSAAVNDDGSFEVRVEGTLEDDYELTVTTRGTSDSTTIELAESDGATTSDAGESDGTATCLERTGADPNEAGTRGPQPVCGTLNAEALCRAAELVSTVASECEDKQDCVVVHRNLECVDSCNSSVVVSARGAAELAVGLASIDETICRDFSEEGCTYIATGCTPASKTVALCEEGQCVAGHVQYGFECSNTVLIDETPTCGAFEAEALCQRDQMLAQLQNSCAKDDECVVFYAQPACAENDCTGNVVVAAMALAEAEAGMAAISDGICRQADDLACEYPGAPCLAGEVTPRCKAGQCVAEGAE